MNSLIAWFLTGGFFLGFFLAGIFFRNKTKNIFLQVQGEKRLLEKNFQEHIDLKDEQIEDLKSSLARFDEDLRLLREESKRECERRYEAEKKVEVLAEFSNKFHLLEKEKDSLEKEGKELYKELAQVMAKEEQQKEEILNKKEAVADLEKELNLQKKSWEALKEKEEGFQLQLVALKGKLSKEESFHEKDIEHIFNLEADIEKKEEKYQLSCAENHSLEKKLTKVRSELEQEKKLSLEKAQATQELTKSFSHTFKSLASEALRHNNQSFLELAKTTLNNYQENAKGDLHERQKTIQRLVLPLEESLRQVDEKMREIERERLTAYTSLTEQVRSLATGQIKLHMETNNLVQALRAPTVRGRWGEIQLKRVVEIAGMLEYCDFTQQESVSTENGMLRPDMIIKLPNKKNIVVDSKAPLKAYLEALDLSEEEAKISKLKDHARHIRSHLNNLSSKAYWEQFQPAPEFAVLFLPGENFFSAALQQDPSLIEYGFEKRVILATPTTLIALLRSVAYGWQEQQMTSNAQAISDLGGILYDRVRGLAAHFAEIRRGLDKSVEAFNKTVGSFEGRVLVAARKFKELGAGNGDDIETLEIIERNSRPIQSVENMLLFSELDDGETTNES